MEMMQKSSNNDKEFMRMAMLKHEETFREQVSELHRLYRIQKVLMESAGVSQQQQKQKHERYNLVESSKKGFTIDHYQQQLLLQAQVQAQAERDIIINNNNNITGKSNIMMMGLNVMRPDNQALIGSGSQRPSNNDNANEHIAESNVNNNKMMMLDETTDDIELTLSLGPTSYNPRRRKNGKSESGQSISSSSTGSSQTKKASPKNNTNISSNNKNSTTAAATCGNFSQGSGIIEPGFSNGQQNSNPPWLYQALSLKLT